MKKSELVARFAFGKAVGDSSTIAEISNSKTNVIIHIREEEEHVDAGSYLFLDPHEIDLFIATLSVFKYKILNPRRSEDDDE
ncbi:hypothetical protein HPT25_28005 [Bacillus sp. BRMEA1]|uniref:hypothetical protein n=1 Tax=Neobacillus endophyticus TaxID=2738405 RepID=UPI001567C2CF|nr:hypothetical protein [Neobacillus endophyticus]NRD81139.1 hypothetical protein [Neobacillus endophyticus]